MTQPLDRNKIPDHPTDHAQLARDWWRDERFRQLPGEEGDHTVFVIDFYDGCKYFGYTQEFVARRTASLSTPLEGWGPNVFVQAHAQHVPYVIRCIKSNLDTQAAKELRNQLATEAPDDVYRHRGCIIQTDNCWLLPRQEPADSTPFLESIQQ